MSKRKQGMFAHARYSEKVFRNLPPNIAKGVERDIAYVLKKDNPNDVKKWNRVLPSQSDIDQTYRTPASRTSNELAIPRIRPQRYVKPKPADLRNEFVSARELLHKDYHSTAESFLPSRDRDSYHTTTTTKEETPTAFKTPENKRRKRNINVEDVEDRVFPQNVDPSVIADRINVGIPHLPLRHKDATSYKDAVTEILQETLNGFIRPSATQVSLGSSRRRYYNETVDPHQSIMDMTGPLNMSRSSTSSTKSVRSESPINSIGDLSHIKHSFVDFTDENFLNLDNTNTPSDYDKSFSSQHYSTLPSQYDSGIPSEFGSGNSSKFDINVASQQSGKSIPSQFDSQSPFNDENNFSFNRSTLRSPLFSSPGLSYSFLGHQSSLRNRSPLRSQSPVKTRTPSISDTFNNLSDEEFHFETTNNSFNFDIFRLEEPKHDNSAFRF